MASPAHAEETSSGITAGVLAGGKATRMGGDDKGLIKVAGLTMVEHVVRGLRPQVASILINANRNQTDYAALTQCQVVGDDVEGFAGPLAGMASLMAAAQTPAVLCVPCDSPLVDANLAGRLAAGAEAAQADIAVAHDGKRLQPVFALIRTRLRDSVLDFLHRGERKIDLWYASQKMVPVDFSDSPDMFLNINTPEERDALEARLAAGQMTGG